MEGRRRRIFARSPGDVRHFGAYTKCRWGSTLLLGWEVTVRWNRRATKMLLRTCRLKRGEGHRVVQRSASISYSRIGVLPYFGLSLSSPYIRSSRCRYRRLGPPDGLVRGNGGHDSRLECGRKGPILSFGKFRWGAWPWCGWGSIGEHGSLTTKTRLTRHHAR